MENNSLVFLALPCLPKVVFISITCTQGTDYSLTPASFYKRSRKNSNGTQAHRTTAISNQGNTVKLAGLKCDFSALTFAL